MATMGIVTVNVLNVEIARDLAMALAELRSDPLAHANCRDVQGAGTIGIDYRCDTCRRADAIIARLAENGGRN